jgi:hypothetical protein
MFVASNEFTFDLFPTASCALKEQINTPCARSGHSFTKVPDTGTVIMFFGYQLRNRNLYSVSYSNPFAQFCDDGTFYTLDLISKSWKTLQPSGDIPLPRCFHSADFNDVSKLAIVGGLIYKDSKPFERLPVQEILLLNIADSRTMECFITSISFSISPR